MMMSRRQSAVPLAVDETVGDLSCSPGPASAYHIMSALESPRVNAVALQLLFMQIVFSALEESRPPSADARAADVDLPDNEAAFYHIEQLGYQVGQRLVERTLLNETKGFPEQLDVIKFLCKDYWNSLFGKSIDNLKTNHRGVYVLQDHHFNWISRFGIDAASSDQTARMAILVSTSLLPAIIMWYSIWPIPADSCAEPWPTWASAPPLRRRFPPFLNVPFRLECSWRLHRHAMQHHRVFMQYCICVFLYSCIRVFV